MEVKKVIALEQLGGSKYLPNRKQLLKHLFLLLNEGKMCGDLPNHIKENMIIYADLFGMRINWNTWELY